MSYHIVYDKQFIKVGNGFLPIVLSGDSNVYDYSKTGKGVGRRSRDFGIFTRIDGEYIQTEEMFNKHVNSNYDYYYEQYHKESNTPKKEYENSFGFTSGLRFNGTIPSFKQYKGMFTNGMKNSLTIEQIKIINPYFKINFHTYNDKNDTVRFDESCDSTESLIDVINKAKDFEKTHKKTVFIKPYFYESDLKRIKSYYFPKTKNKTKTFAQGETYYTVNMNGYGNFLKFTKCSIKYSYNGKKIKTMAEVNRIINKIRTSYPSINCTFTTSTIK